VSGSKYILITANIVDAFASPCLFGAMLLVQPCFMQAFSYNYARLVGCGEPNAGTSEIFTGLKIYSLLINYLSAFVSEGLSTISILMQLV
jgi:hypothetical protein